MQVVTKKLIDIEPYENNPRRNNEAVEYVANSIERFGFKNPIIIDKNGVIIAGHTRWLAAQTLGLTEAPCIIADDLTEEEVKAYRLADNKVGEIAGWDYDLLAEELQALGDFDMTDFGFDMDDWEAPPEPTPRESGEDPEGSEEQIGVIVTLKFKTIADWESVREDLDKIKGETGAEMGIANA